MKRNLSELKSDFLMKLSQDSSNTNYTTSEQNVLINKSIEYLAVLIEYPRKIDSSTSLVDGTQTYNLPSDCMKPIRVYFGDSSISNDLQLLEIITEERLSGMHPNWLETTSSSKDRPQYFVLYDRDTFALYPRPNSKESASGKKIYISYVYYPAELTDDSSYPDLPQVFHELISLCAVHLAYLGREKNPDLAKKTYDDLIKKIKSIQSQSTNEVSELYFDFENLDYDCGNMLNESI